MSLCRWSIAAYLALVLLLLSNFGSAQEQPAAPSPSAAPSDAPPPSPIISTSSSASTQASAQVQVETARSSARAGGSLVSHSDVYIARNQRECFETRNLVSCIKYKASKLIWRLATNGMGFFPNEYERALGEQQPRLLRLVQLGEPADDIVVFNDAKSLAGDSELMNIFKFLKRAVETFGRNHGLQLTLPKGSAARVMDEGESRGARKKKKWLILLPLIILMKIAHLKMTVVTLLLGVLGMNVLLVGGTGWLIHYLKYKTLCKIHPHMVQTHSHVYDSDPTDYSQFLGSSFSNSYSPSSPHEVNANGYGKEWARTSNPYHGYNYLDTISKRVQ